MWHTLQLTQGGATLFDFTNGGNAVLSDWIFGEGDRAFVTDTLRIHIVAADAMTDLATQVLTLERILEYARENDDKRKAGQSYTPIWLEAQPLGEQTLFRSEVLGGKARKENNFLHPFLRQYTLSNVKVQLWRRDYFEETAELLLQSSDFPNNGDVFALSAVRGDLPCPVRLVCGAGTTDEDDQVIAAILADVSDPENHIGRLEADSSGGDGYTVAFGNNTAAYVNANFSGGNGAEIAPANTNEQMRIRWTLNGLNGKPIADQIHRLHLFLRGYELSGSGSGYMLRARMGLQIDSTRQWGRWGDAQKTFPAPGAYTTRLPLLDMGILALPDFAGVDTSAIAFQIVIEVWGQAASATGPNVRIDCAYPLPVWEGGMPGNARDGYCTATLKKEMNASYVGVLNAHDRVPKAYLADTSEKVIFPYADMGGAPLFVPPNKQVGMYVLTRASSDAQGHTHGVSNTISVYATPRYRLPLSEPIPG